MKTRVDVKPALLDWAVTRSGLAADTLADKFSHLEDWLAGTASPTLNQLEAFAKRTNTPLGFLFLPEPPDQRAAAPGFEEPRSPA